MDDRAHHDVEEVASHSPLLPPAAPMIDDASANDVGKPPLSPSIAQHARKKSVQSQISEVTLDDPQRSFSWDSKNVANEIDQVSRESRAEEQANKEATTAKPGHLLTLSQISKACPVEEEAERLILKSLDERKDRDKLGSHILPQVPDNSASAFQTTETNPSDASGHVENEAAPAHLHTSLSAVNSPSLHISVPADDHASGPSAPPVAEAQPPDTLFAKVLHAIRRRPRTESTANHETPDIDGGLEEHAQETTSNADALVQNANILFRRTNHGKKPSPDIERGDPSDHSDPTGKSKGRKRNRQTNHIARKAKIDVKNELSDFDDFLRPHKGSMQRLLKNELAYLILPLTCIAAILFYGTGNPELGNTGASISYLFLFLVRNIIVFTLGKATSVYVIDYLSLSRRFTVKIFGPVIALAIVQSKGYPSVTFFFGLWSFILLCGSGAFARHWLFWQSAISMCNANNPAGTITDSRFYVSLVGCCLLFGAAVAGKRLWLGLYMGKRSYLNYKDKFDKTTDDVLLVSKVAELSQPSNARNSSETASDVDSGQSFHSIDYSQSSSPDENSVTDCGSVDYDKHDGLNSSQRAVIQQHLEEWEEPDAGKSKPNDASIGEVLEFRQSLTRLDNTYPFTVAFGPASKRETCFESAQKVYYRLLILQKSGDVLSFDTVAVVALNEDGTMDQGKMKELVRLFRPNRQGQLSEVDFLKSIDSLYKELRLLQASIENSGSVDRAFEIMCNYIFFIILWCILLYIVGIDPLALFVSLSSFVVGFAFMIGSASSKYFEGILFIFARRPFDIGDRVNISNVEHDTSPDGSMTWFVEDLGLYSTTVRLAATNEVATYSNGSLANSRVINAARSPKAIVAIYLKFSVGVKYEKLQLCKKTVEKFVKERPREWITLQSFRANNVEQDQGYVQYKLQLQHRESWQNLNAILSSKAELTSFCLEVAKQLGMRYVPPPLPVDLSMSADRESPTQQKASDNNPSHDGVSSSGFQVASDLRAQLNPAANPAAVSGQGNKS